MPFDYEQYQIENSDIQVYDRPAFGYQVITLNPTRPGRFFTLYTVIEYQYGSTYSYPARNEAEARKHADRCAMSVIYNHWQVHATRMEVRIYPFGGLIRDMRLVPRKRRLASASLLDLLMNPKLQFTFSRRVSTKDSSCYIY